MSTPRVGVDRMKSKGGMKQEHSLDTTSKDYTSYYNSYYARYNTSFSVSHIFKLNCTTNNDWLVSTIFCVRNTCNSMQLKFRLLSWRFHWPKRGKMRGKVTRERSSPSLVADRATFFHILRRQQIRQLPRLSQI